jgi:hypothetical protein
VDSGDSLKDRILNQMVSRKEEDKSVVSKMLDGLFDAARDYFVIRHDGRITIQKPRMSAQSQVLAYLIGAGYSKEAELREDDGVSNRELVDELKLNESTVRNTLLNLRKKGLVVQKIEGIHRIEYRRVDTVLKSLSKAPERQSLPKPSSTRKSIFSIYSQSGKNGLYEYLDKLNVEELKGIIKENRLDASGKTLKWEDKNLLVDFVAERIGSRSAHGDVFLKQSEPRVQKSTHRRLGAQTKASAETSSILPPKGKQGILEFGDNDVRFPNQAFNRLTFEEAIGLLLLEVGVPLTSTQIAHLISRGFKKIDANATRVYLMQERRKLRRYVIREGDGFRLTGQGTHWVTTEIIPKLQDKAETPQD